MTDGRDLPAFIWRAWLPIAWALPILLVTHGLFFDSGWTTLGLLFLSPILVPALGLLGALPRFILRKRGARQTPTAIMRLLFVNWTAGGALILTLSQPTDGTPLPSLLERLAPGPLSSGSEAILIILLLLTAVGTWVCLITIASVCQIPEEHPAQTPAPRRYRSYLATGIGFLAVPTVTAAVVLLGVADLQGTKDGAGHTLAYANTLSVSQQARLAEEHIHATDELARQAVGALRTGEWRLKAAAFPSTPTSTQDRCYVEDAECYVVTVSYQLSGAELRSRHHQMSHVRRALGSIGWTPVDAGARRASFENDSGHTLWMMPHTNGLTLTVESPTYWGDTLAFSPRIDLEEELQQQDRP